MHIAEESSTTFLNNFKSGPYGNISISGAYGCDFSLGIDWYGTHDELLAKQAQYAELFKMQAQYYTE